MLGYIAISTTPHSILPSLPFINTWSPGIPGSFTSLQGLRTLGGDAGLPFFLPNCQYHHPFKLAWLLPWASQILQVRHRPHRHVHNHPYAPEDAFQALENTFLIFFICLVLYLQNQHRVDTQIFVGRMGYLGSTRVVCRPCSSAASSWEAELVHFLRELLSL